MLIQRLRISEPYAEAAIAHNLVDLALQAPESSFLEIIKAFSSLSLSVQSEDPRFSNNMVNYRAPSELARDQPLDRFWLRKLGLRMSCIGDRSSIISICKNSCRCSGTRE
jgi:hypothetical protein